MTALPKLNLRNTSRYGTDIVEQAVRFALKSVCKTDGRLRQEQTVRVWVRNTRRTWGGRALVGQPRCMVAIGRPSCFPARCYDSRYVAAHRGHEIEFHDFIECLVGVAAHELYHCHGMGGRRHGEFHCSAALVDAVEEFRRQRPKFEAELAVRRQREAQRLAALHDRAANRERVRRSPEHQLGKLLDAQQRWERKLKLAQTKLQKLNRRIAARERAMRRAAANSPAAAP